MNDRLSLYLHIPFCERKCVYCDFYSIEDRSAQSRFVDAICKEIELKVNTYPRLRGASVRTIFFGGGTPSLLKPNELAQIITTIKNNFDLLPSIEFTLECNPGTITEHNLAAYRTLGANRLSFGVQSFHQDELDWLSRIHSADDARRAVRATRAVGFDNVSIDLMFALPGQNKEKLEYSLDEALALETNHLSVYNLTVEEGTPLNRMVKLHQVTEMDVDQASELYELVQEKLSTNGFTQYEISNYALSDDLRCKHNLAYWDGYDEYVSFGPSAHEFFGGERSWNLSSLDRYLERIDASLLPRNNSEHPSIKERRTEILFCGLRSTGIDLRKFSETFNENIVSHSAIAGLVSEGLIEFDHETLKLTLKGYRYCDAVVVRLM
ncbi:MAG TPA: radical SAM family heme chaperone HemW [Candidatus Kapabacteria bacterium]|nr:radical SAM family heme chaperone HemW [Candidatus Kapabacteria bacterium]